MVSVISVTVTDRRGATDRRHRHARGDRPQQRMTIESLTSDQRNSPSSQCGWSATLTHMTTIASRDLRNHTADVLRQVSGGTHVTITVNGLPVAEISPIRSARKQFMSKTDLIEIMTRRQADPGLRDDLAVLAGETTDVLDPL